MRGGVRCRPFYLLPVAPLQPRTNSLYSRSLSTLCLNEKIEIQNSTIQALPNPVLTAMAGATAAITLLAAIYVVAKDC